jgi:ABC-type multidrug transport system ATPase subunit
MHFNEGVVQYAVGSGQSAVGSPLVAEGLPKETAVVPAEEVYKYISLCAPYLEVVEEMTLKEFLDFHHGFKPFIKGLTIDSIISILGLEKAAGKQIRYYSSGMKQRVKLAQCIFSDTPVVLLDEPCTNLDTTGIDLYHQLIEMYCKNRMVVVSSNDEVEYKFCREKIMINDYKK